MRYDRVIGKQNIRPCTAGDCALGAARPAAAAVQPSARARPASLSFPRRCTNTTLALPNKMRVVAAVLLAQLGGKANPTADDVKKILGSGASPENN